MLPTHSRKSSMNSPGSQGSGSNTPKHHKSNSYVQLSPKYNPENGLVFQNEIKEMKIKTQEVRNKSTNMNNIGQLDSIQCDHYLNQKQNEQKEMQKKSQFSKLQSTDF